MADSHQTKSWADIAASGKSSSGLTSGSLAVAIQRLRSTFPSPGTTFNRDASQEESYGHNVSNLKKQRISASSDIQTVKSFQDAAYLENHSLKENQESSHSHRIGSDYPLLPSTPQVSSETYSKHESDVAPQLHCTRGHQSVVSSAVTQVAQIYEWDPRMLESGNASQGASMKGIRGNTNKEETVEAATWIGAGCENVTRHRQWPAADAWSLGKQVTANLHQPLDEKASCLPPVNRKLQKSFQLIRTNQLLTEMAKKNNTPKIVATTPARSCQNSEMAAPAPSNATNCPEARSQSKAPVSLPSGSTFVNHMPVKSLNNTKPSGKNPPSEPQNKTSVQPPETLSKAQKKRRARKAKNEKPGEQAKPKPSVILELPEPLPKRVTKSPCVVQNNPNTGITTTVYPRGHLLGLPDEILVRILQECLASTAPSGVPIDPMFDPSPPHSPCLLDYRVIHACRHFYDLGIAQMYEINTWAIDLRAFQDFPKLYQMWPIGFGIDIGMRHIRRIVLMNDMAGTNMWDHAIRCLRGFLEHGGVNLPRGGRIGLRKLTFDVRPRALRALQGWREGPVPVRVTDLLKKAGLMEQGMLDEGVWVAAGSMEELEYQRNLPDGGFGGLCGDLEKSLKLAQASAPLLGGNA